MEQTAGLILSMRVHLVFGVHMASEVYSHFDIPLFERLMYTLVSSIGRDILHLLSRTPLYMMAKA